MKKLLSILLVLALMFSMLPAGLAEEIRIVGEPDLIPIVEPGEGERLHEIHVNPLYRNVLSEETLSAEMDAIEPNDWPTADCPDAQSVVLALREGLKARAEEISIHYTGSEALDYYGLVDEAMAHTGNPTEGDYLLWVYGGWGLGGTTVDFTYTFLYYTDADQEAEMDAAAAALLEELDLAGKSDYQKVLAVYTYICDNITYDYEHLEDENYLLMYTAYAALVNKTAVCQGYAVLLYRLLLSLGVDIRVVTSVTHAWNIIGLEGLYYNADSTWDAGNTSFVWFLLNMEHFSRDPFSIEHHEREEPYNGAEFMAAYPMSETDYVPEEEPPEAAVPEYLTVNGEVFRLSRGLECGAEALDGRVVVGESDGKYYALDVADGSVVATELTLTEDGLSGDVAVYNSAMQLSDGRQIYIRMTDEATGAAVLTVGTPPEDHQAYWIDFGWGSIIHRQYCCDYQPGVSKPYGNWLWFLTFRNGAFGCSERGNEYEVQFSGFCPEDTQMLLYTRFCDHENKVAVPAAEADCTHFGHSLYYTCPDCGLKLDPSGEFFTTRTNDEGEAYFDYYSLADFYTGPALGHDYDPETGICSRCGEKAPVYEKVTSEAQLAEGCRYLLVDNETGLALEVSHAPAVLASDGSVPNADCTVIATTPLADGKLTVYGTGGAAFRLTMHSPYPGEELMGYPAEIDGGFSLVEDYSWEFDHPLSTYDLAFQRDGAGFIDVWDPELEDYVTCEEVVLATGLVFAFLSNGDVGARFYDGMHPIIYDPEMGFRLREEWVFDEYWDDDTGETVFSEFPAGVSLYREVIDEALLHEAEISEVTNYSHFDHRSQYYEGAFVVWKEHVTIDGTPIQTYDEGTKKYTDNYTDEQLEEMGITVSFFDAETGEPAIIDYDSPNVNYFGGPARTGSYYAVVTQTVNGIVAEISDRVPFEIAPTLVYKFTDYADRESGSRAYLYSIVGEIDGQLYVMAMPTTDAELRMPAIPLEADENGALSLGANRENIFMLQLDYHSFGDASHPNHNLYHLTTGTALDIYISGSYGTTFRGRFTLTGDDGFYINTDPDNNYAAEIFEPHMGHGAFMLVEDEEGEVFFTRAMWATGHASTELGSVSEYPVYLYWNQAPTEPISSHSYEFLGTPYDKVYDGEPIDFDPYKNIQVDGGKTSWAELEKMGVVQFVWREWQGKEVVDLEAPPVDVGMYEIAIQELDGKEWVDALTETFFITEAEHTHVYGEPVWAWAEDYSAATATFSCECGDAQTVDATVDSERNEPTHTEDGKIVYTATVVFNETTYTDTQEVVLPASGHSYGEPVWAWAEDYSAATATFSCECGDAQTVAATVDSERNEPTHTEDGEIVYTATVVFNEVTYTDTQEVVLPASGHSYGEPVWAWAEDYSAATATFSCECGDEQILDAEISSERTEPTTEADGQVVYTATVGFLGTVYTDTQTETLPKLPDEPIITPIICIDGMSTKGIDVGWALFNGMVDTELQRRSTGDWETVNTGFVIGYSDANVLMGQTYFYRLRISNGTEWSDWSEELEVFYNPFSDVSGKKTTEYVAWAFNNGIVNGTSSTTFTPDDPCTRIQFIMMLWKMHGSPVVGGTNPFSDISGKKTTNAILWALDAGVINYGDTFNPDGNISRVQIVMILWKLAGSPEVTGENPFVDVTGKKTTKAVLWAYQQGITKGTDKTHFAPDDDCTRVQLVVFLYKYNGIYHVI